MATLYLIHGYLGAGKSYYSRDLARRLGAVRLSTDESYLNLFSEGQPSYDLDHSAMRRVIALLNALWPPITAAGVDVVLDFGFWSRELRDQVRSMADSVGVATQLHSLQCREALALQRCLERNGEVGAFLISHEGFFELRKYFEPLGEDEPFLLVESGK